MRTFPASRLPVVIIAALAMTGAACGRNAAPIAVALETDRPGGATVRVTGLSSSELSALRGLGTESTAWTDFFTIRVAGASDRPVAGRYTADRDAVIFTPVFPLDPGREYVVRFDPAGMPAPRIGQPVETRLALPAGPARSPSAVVAAVYPSADVWPENLLRFYLHFSAPMSRTPSTGVVRLVDASGETIADALLEMDVDLWNDDATRCTVFFDPGRVKRGIRPNLELGRALVAGRRYAIVVDAAWKDAHGQPLASAFRWEFTAGPAIERAIDTAEWRITPPTAGSRDPLDVSFPWALDHALLQRTIGVIDAGGRAMAGSAETLDHERRWRFVPATPWPAGDLRLVIDRVLEDVSGNQIGRPFEIEGFDPAATQRLPDRVTMPFRTVTRR